MLSLYSGNQGRTSLGFDFVQLRADLIEKNFMELDRKKKKSEVIHSRDRSFPYLVIALLAKIFLIICKFSSISKYRVF